MLVERIEEKITKESVNNSRTRRELRIIGIKRRKNFDKSIVYNGTSDFFSLIPSK